jgi:hypothetical protein
MHGFEIFLALFLLMNAGFILSYSAGNSAARPNLPMLYMALASLVVFLHFGKMHQILPQKPEYESGLPAKAQTVYFNWPEIFPYYLGAKYFPELGYKGLYDTIALADSESAYPALGRETLIRDLNEPYKKISAIDAKARAEKNYLPEFKGDRWPEFKRDYEYLKNLAFPGWVEQALQHRGLHVPPTWMVVGHPIANALPITGHWPYGAWLLGANWTQAEMLPLLDVALLFLSFLCLLWGFGLAAASSFILFVAVSYFTPLEVVGGAFLRFDWLFGLAAGLAGLRKKHFFFSGFMLAFATALRLFPAFFLASAGLAILLQKLLGKEPLWGPVVKFALGAILCGLLFFTFSVKMFPRSPAFWLDFKESIFLHQEAAYVDNIGFKKIAPYFMAPQLHGYKEEGSLEKFQTYTDAMRDFWFQYRALLYGLLLMVVAGCSWSMRQVPTFEGTLLMGGFSLFIFAMPAHYYFAFLALVPVVLSHPKFGGLRTRILALLFTIYWLIAYFSPYLLPDPVTRNFCLSLLLGMYFLIWMMANWGQKGYSGE